MPIITARTYSRAVVQDREIADVIAVNEAHGCLDDHDRENFRRDRARAWRDITALPAPKPAPKDTSDWYAAQIAATEARIARRKAAIERWENRPRVDARDARAAINAPLKQRQRGMAGEMKAWRAYEYATSDLPAAQARLAWLHERNPA